jgi:amidase
MKVAQDLAFVPAAEQARLVRERDVSPVELVQMYLERIETLDPKLDAYLTVVPELALEQARQAEASVGAEGLPPFHGVPISIKDLHDTAGIRTTHGTRAWADRVPDRDSHSVSKLRSAGFIILGKTNTPEFGKSIVTEPLGYPPCRNPWDPERTPGGSSGGAAAALAAGLCPVSHGSDGGGSIRIPASCCGVFGLKPSRGRISNAPAFPSLTGTVGALARTVADAAALVDAMAGYESGDAFWAPPLERPLLEEAGRPPGRLRVAFTIRAPVPDVEVAPGNRKAVEDTAELLAELGHDVEEAVPDWGEDFTPSLVARASDLVGRDDLPPVEMLDPLTRFLYEASKDLSVRDYLRGLDQLQASSRRIVAFFDTYDVLLTPTIATQPPRVGEFADILESIEGVMRLRGIAPFAGVWNNTGQPAVSVPMAWDDDGLPVGVQLVGRPADEATLIRVSAQLEEACPWADRRPPIS